MTKNVFTKAKWRFQVENKAYEQMYVYADWFLKNYCSDSFCKLYKKDSLCYLVLKNIKFKEDRVEIDYYDNPYGTKKTKHAIILRQYIVSFNEFINFNNDRLIL